MPLSTVEIGTTATRISGTLGRHRRGGITFRLPSSAAVAVFLGDSPAVTTSEGMSVDPGTERTYEGAAAAREFFGIVSAGTEDLIVEEAAKRP